MPDIPEGWTDDMTIPLPLGRTEAEVVEFVIRSAMNDMPAAEIVQLLATEFHLSDDDAALAWDRTFGGIVRAATHNPANCPSRTKDPLAWESYQRASQDPMIISRLLPNKNVNG